MSDKLSSLTPQSFPKSRTQDYRKTFQSYQTNYSNSPNTSMSPDRGSCGDYSKRSIFETDFPIFKRSHSLQRYSLSTKFIEGIKEEKNEDDDRTNSPFFYKKGFSPITFMPKEEVIFFESKNKQDPLIQNLTNPIMDTIPEIDDDTRKDELCLKSPRIRIPSDMKEDAKIATSKSHFVSKAPVSESDVITEEKENENVNEIEFYKKHKEKFRAKYEHFIDKEEPPRKEIQSVQGDCLPCEDVIKEANVEEESKIGVGDFLRSKSRKKYNNIYADEIDEEQKDKPIKIPTILAKIDSEEIINELDEYNNNNN